jgi:hypothetical protein
LLLVVIAAVSSEFVRGAEMSAAIDRPKSEHGPTEVSVGIWVVDIRNIDSAQQTFTAEIAVILQWKDARLVHTSSGVMRYPLDEIWHPRVAIANETSSVIRKFPAIVEVEPDGTLKYEQLYAGAFRQPLRLQSFPFDRQTFHIELVAGYRPDDVRFVPDQDFVGNGLQHGAGIAPALTLPDWTIEKWETKPLTYTIGPGLQFSSYVFEFTAARKVQNYIFKVIFPLVLIVMMSWSGFWIDPVHAGSQISIAMTSMLTLIAYRFIVDTQLPRLAYMTRLDLLFLVSTSLVFFALIEVVVTTILDNKQQTQRAKKIDRYCRFIFPAVFALSSIAIFAHPRG